MNSIIDLLFILNRAISKISKRKVFLLHIIALVAVWECLLINLVGTVNILYKF